MDTYLKKFIFIYAFCLASTRITDARLVARCTTPSIPNAKLTCTTKEVARKYIHATHCKIHCNKNYGYISGPKAIDCYRGIWLHAGNDHVPFTTPTKCQRAFSGDGRRSMRRMAFSIPVLDGMCSNNHCKGRYNGITERMCIRANCCWDATEKDCFTFLEQKCQVAKADRKTCPGTWYGYPKSRCESKGCCFDSVKNTCYSANLVGSTKPPPKTTTPKPEIGKVSPCEEDLENSLENGILTCNTTDGVKRCTAQCHDKYVLEGVATRSCHIAKQEWSPGAWNCRLEFCNEIKTLQKTFVDCTNGAHIESICRASCARGYKLTSNKNQATCLPQGEWSAPTHWKCKEIQCPVLKLNNVIIQGATSFDGTKAAIHCTKARKFGSVCAVNCPLGYIHSGQRSIKCSVNGRWSTGHFRCLPLSCTRPLISSSLDYSCTSEYRVGSECTFTCPAGFKLDGQESITCRGNQRWSLDSYGIKCIETKECGVPIVPKSAVLECTKGNNVGSLCSVSCPSGELLRGYEVNVMACSDDLTWIPSFEGELCEGPPKCGNLTKVFPEAEWNKLETVCTGDDHLGSVCTIQCSELQQKPIVTTCTYNLDGVTEWSTPPPTRCIDLAIEPCGIEIDLSSGKVTAHANSHQYVQVSTPTLPRWRQWMSRRDDNCEYQTLLNVNYTKLTGFEVRMTYGVPSSVHFEVSAEQGGLAPQTLKAKNFDLVGVPGFTRKKIFQSKTTVNFSWKKAISNVTYEVGSGIESTIPMDFGSSTMISIGVNRAVNLAHSFDISNMGSGVCKICLAYASVN